MISTSKLVQCLNYILLILLLKCLSPLKLLSFYYIPLFIMTLLIWQYMYNTLQSVNVIFLYFCRNLEENIQMFNNLTIKSCFYQAIARFMNTHINPFSYLLIINCIRQTKFWSNIKIVNPQHFFTIHNFKMWFC